MRGTVFTVIGLVIGVLILGAGVYYLAQEKDNAESRKIYGITCIVGVVIIIGILIKIAAAGF